MTRDGLTPKAKGKGQQHDKRIDKVASKLLESTSRQSKAYRKRATSVIHGNPTGGHRHFKTERSH